MQTLDIAEVARRTGLTVRALRFYEARGLVAPLRSASGRRFYGAGELARLNAVAALKRAGFSLAEIGGLLAQRRADLARLVTARLEAGGNARSPHPGSVPHRSWRADRRRDALLAHSIRRQGDGARRLAGGYRPLFV